MEKQKRKSIMEKPKGKSLSVYVSPEHMAKYEELKYYSDQTGISVSELICRRMDAILSEEILGIRITDRALDALAHGRFGELRLVKPYDGMRVVITEEDVLLIMVEGEEETEEHEG